MQNLKERIKRKAFSKFAEILEKYTEIEIVEENGYIFAKGETKKHKQVLQICSFVWNNRLERWEFSEFRRSNYFTDLKLKRLKQELGVS